MSPSSNFSEPHVVAASSAKELPVPSSQVAQSFNDALNWKLTQPAEPSCHVTNGSIFTKPTKLSTPVTIPISIRHRQTRPAEPEHETFDIPETSPYEYAIRKTAAEADKDLKELFEGAIDDGVDQVDMDEAIVDGFKDEIVLKRHQV